jgi:hypothetical protein
VCKRPGPTTPGCRRTTSTTALPPAAQPGAVKPPHRVPPAGFERVARVPDRRRAHKSVPSPARSQLRRTSSRISCRQTGAKPRFLWAIDDLQRGGRAADARASIWRISPAGKSLSGTPCSTAFGAVATVFFREVAFSGYDVYGAKFACRDKARGSSQSEPTRTTVGPPCSA